MDPALIHYLKKNYPNLHVDRQREIFKSIKDFKHEIAGTDDGQKMIQSKVDELEEQIMELKNELLIMNAKAANCDDRNDWIMEMMIEEQKANIKNKENKRWRLKNLLPNKDGWYEIGGIDDVDISEIKQIPIGNLMESDAKVSTNNREMFLCPIHNEKTGSFIWYKENNSWYCFGCHKGGDVIQLYMEMNECEFYEAIKQLS